LVREFIEIKDIETFRKVAEQSPLIIRKDPFLFAQYFSVMFFIRLTNLEQGEIKKLFEMLKGKMIVIENLVKASSIADFIEKEGR
jgi:hypothetical protein